MNGVRLALQEVEPSWPSEYSPKFNFNKKMLQIKMIIQHEYSSDVKCKIQKFFGT